MSDLKSPVVSLKSLLVPSKEVEVEYPGMPGFKVKLAFLSREVLLDLRKRATTTKFSRGREVSEQLDDELFLQLFVQKTIKGWTGFKFSYLGQLAPVNLDEIQNLDDELAYSDENALFLMKHSADFDSYVNSIITDLGNFPKSSSKK